MTWPALVDLLIGVVPHLGQSASGSRRYAVTNAERGISARRRRYDPAPHADYINHICPQFQAQPISNFQRVPTVEPPHPFILAAHPLPG